MRRLDLLRLMTLVRQQLYCGQPAPWPEVNDWGILKRLLAKYGEDDVTAAITGLVWLRDHRRLKWAPPGTPMTLRALTAKSTPTFFNEARAAAWRLENSARG